MKPTLINPIMGFMRGCDHLLRSPISRHTLTVAEMKIIKLYVRELTERFSSEPTDPPSPESSEPISPAQSGPLTETD